MRPLHRRPRLRLPLLLVRRRLWGSRQEEMLGLSLQASCSSGVPPDLAWDQRSCDLDGSDPARSFNWSFRVHRAEYRRPRHGKPFTHDVLNRFERLHGTIGKRPRLRCPHAWRAVHQKARERRARPRLLRYARSLSAGNSHLADHEWVTAHNPEPNRRLQLMSFFTLIVLVPAFCNSDNNRSSQPIYNWAKNHPHDFTMKLCSKGRIRKSHGGRGNRQ
jgi:hypothetical protein